jgi:TatD DNase family protein
MNFVDFHCHLDLYPDFEAAVMAAETAQVYTLSVTTTPRAWQRNYELTRNTKFVRAALGLHPQLVAEHSDDIELWDKHVNQARFIGEIGIDAGPRHYKSLDAQKQVFEHVLKTCAGSGQKILTIHSVRAVTAVLDRVERFLPLNDNLAVLHWFTGSTSELRRAVELGCYFSVNAQMLIGERRCAIVRQIPLDRLLTESDGPFTTYEDRPASPADVRHTVTELARCRGIDPQGLARTIQRNLGYVMSRQRTTGG